MINRVNALRKLAVGDIFHARSSNGASLICLVTGIDEDTIQARRIHTQDDHKFERSTGLECGKAHTRIDCVAPFPPDIHDIFLKIDTKHRQLTELFRKGIEPDPEQRIMSADEKRANLSINPHVMANPI
jgi:hypothetical protein